MYFNSGTKLFLLYTRFLVKASSFERPSGHERHVRTACPRFEGQQSQFRRDDSSTVQVITRDKSHDDYNEVSEVGGSDNRHTVVLISQNLGREY